MFMNNKELELILSEGEGQFIEFKESFSDKVIETIIAFSNSKGGKIFLGISDKKEIKGISLGKETIVNWINEVKNKTEPFLNPEFDILNINNKKIICINVLEFPLKPVSFKGLVFIRKNNMNFKLSPKEISEIYLRTKNSSWDFYFKENISLNDLDDKKITKVRKIIEKNIGTKFINNYSFLKKYDLISSEQITNACYLLFSKKELRETEIQIGLFADVDVIKKSKLIKTDLITEVEEVIDFIQAYILKEYIITGNPQREEKWQYPLKAIREFIINAIIHKDYQDGLHTQIKIFPSKIEIFNIGKLPYDVLIDDVVRGNEKSHPRNRLIAEIFRDCGFIERYGSGISRALKEVYKFGLIKPSITEKSGGFEVVVYDELKKDLDKDLDKDLGNSSENRILSLMKENKNITQKELSAKVGINARNIRIHIAKLKKKSLIERIGSDKSGYWQVK